MTDGHHRLAVLGARVDALPECSGVYSFLDGNGHALYIGKSINIRKRVREHLRSARESGRQQRMVRGTAVIDCRPTAGEAGALLLENAAIKREMPLFNRRQRSVRRMWSITLEKSADGFLRPALSAFTLDSPDIRAAYGSYASRYHGKRALEKLAREHQLCPAILGLQRGPGACFQYQLGRCLGACKGLESPQPHNRRLATALERGRLSAWPITEPVWLHEVAEDRGAVQPPEEWHLLHNWTYLGTYRSPTDAGNAQASSQLMFDRDTYFILRGILERGSTRLLQAGSLNPVYWPGQ